MYNEDIAHRCYGQKEKLAIQETVYVIPCRTCIIRKSYGSDN